MAAAQRPPASDRTPLTATALCLAGLFLALTAVSLTTVERIKYFVLADRSAATPARLVGTLHAADFALFAIAAACGLGVLVLEVRSRGLGRLLAAEAPLPLALAVAAMLLWFSHALLAPGLIVTGDGGTHVARVNHLAMAIRDGSSLYWDNYFFAGGTLLQFTGPVFHWLATAITLAVGDATTGVKIAAVACRIAAALAMFACLRRAGLDRTAAVLGCLFFAGAFYVTYLVSIRSTFPQIVILATLPAMVYGIECVLAAPRVFGRGWLVLCLAAIILIGNHPPTAVMAAVLLGLYVLARIGLDGWRIRAAPVVAAGGWRDRARQRLFPGAVRARAIMDRRECAEPTADFPGLAAIGRAAQLCGLGSRRHRPGLYRLCRSLHHCMRARRRAACAAQRRETQRRGCG